MSKSTGTQEKHIHLSQEQADRLSALAQSRQMSEDYIIEKALDIMFNLTEILEEDVLWPSRINRQPYLPQVDSEANQIKERHAEYQFKRDLIKLGLLEEIREFAPPLNTEVFAPIPVDGKPLSEIIIEERR